MISFLALKTLEVEPQCVRRRVLEAISIRNTPDVGNLDCFLTFAAEIEDSDIVLSNAVLFCFSEGVKLDDDKKTCVVGSPLRPAMMSCQ